ncbi:hypothetical protein [Zobellia sp. 1_MG-2023]|uniref:hypothetical protein n=1 Tax=Zobellia sp. 1_MG-2023 TaxID=3062626 RepID=UPI0026E31DF1|nr:hypothetical protein [Zobellia sp. 1_MG-2023]MDO6818983.1 hypothetical protein [Zobellia sp. 1_MG-2023]
MKNNLITIASYAPVIIYMVYSSLTREPNSGINWIEVVTAALLGGVGNAIGNRMKSKN